MFTGFLFFTSQHLVNFSLTHNNGSGAKVGSAEFAELDLDAFVLTVTLVVFGLLLLIPPLLRSIKFKAAYNSSRPNISLIFTIF